MTSPHRRHPINARHRPGIALAILLLGVLLLGVLASGSLVLASPDVQDGAATPPAPEAPAPLSDEALQEWQALEDVEAQYLSRSANLAWGDPNAVSPRRAAEIQQKTGEAVATHGVYTWPFDVTFTMGHAIQSYQNYSSGISQAYFHHGLDLITSSYNLPIYNRSGGQVVNIENYQPGNALYWEVAVLDPDGYVWQYHHVVESSIPTLIRNKYAEYQANPTTGGFIPPDTFIGNNIQWPVSTFGYYFHHLHLNILGAGGAFMNGFEFHTLLADTAPPQIQEIGLLQNDRVQTATSISGAYGLYVRARDLALSPVYWLPPYKVEFSVDGGPLQTVWEFATLPGGASKTAYVNDYFVPFYSGTTKYTRGDYSYRDFYIDLGFTTSGQRVFPTANGPHTVNVTVYDYNGNTANSSFTWTVTGGPTATFTPSPTFTVTNTPTATYTPTPTYTPTATATPTVNPACVTYASSEVPKALPLGSASTSSALSIAGAVGLIGDLNVDVTMPHPWVGDLSFTLTHQETGTAVKIVDRPGFPAAISGCSGDDILATLDDEAAALVESQCAAIPPAINGWLRPNNPLYAFDGESANGTWLLRVDDAFPTGEAGSLNAWSLTLCLTDTPPPTPTPTFTPTPTATPTVRPVGDTLYLSTTNDGTVDSVAYDAADILSWDSNTGVWSLYFDGSDVGLTGNLDAFELLDDGSILMSLAAATTIPGAGSVADSDLVRFAPTTLGATTAGAFTLYFDGSDVGLAAGGEDIDALARLPDGRLVMSFLGNWSVPGASGTDEDLALFTPTALGATTTGAWSFYFDGSDVALTASSENVFGVWLDNSGGGIFLTTSGAYAAPGVSGDGADIFICQPGSLGATTTCSFGPYWDGSLYGLAGRVVDAFSIKSLGFGLGAASQQQ